MKRQLPLIPLPADVPSSNATDARKAAADDVRARVRRAIADFMKRKREERR